MKKYFVLLPIGILLILCLSACNLPMFASSPQDTQATETTSENADGREGDPAALPAVDLSAAGVGTAVVWYDNSILVFVPGGEFTMGNDGEDTPEHTVLLDDFWVYKTKVTNDMYRMCVNTKECTPPAAEDTYPDYLDPEIKDHPIIGVTWEQAETYCEWMNGHLPTEAQWEKVARGPEGNPYPWGDDTPTCDLLNFEACGLKQTSKVYDYPDGMSYYEAYDMAGSAYEWVGDWYGFDYYNQSDEENPTGPEDGTVRVVRGSSFTTSDENLESALRFGIDPTTTREDLGFRCVIGTDAFQFAPYCQIAAHIPLPDWPFPEFPYGEAEEGPEGPGTYTCEAPMPDLSATQYCSDQGSSTGGATVTYVGELVEVDPGCVEGPSPMGCTAHEGSTLEARLCTSCEPGDIMLDALVPSCSLGYELVDGVCEFAGVGPMPGGVCPPGWFHVPGEDTCTAGFPPSEECPAGFHFFDEVDCCIAAFTDTSPDFPGFPPHSYPGCPIGLTYDPVREACIPEDPEVIPGMICETFSFTVGYCEEGGDDDDDTCEQQTCGPQNPVWCAATCSCIGPADPCP